MLSRARGIIKYNELAQTHMPIQHLTGQNMYQATQTKTMLEFHIYIDLKKIGPKIFLENYSREICPSDAMHSNAAIMRNIPSET